MRYGQGQIPVLHLTEKEKGIHCHPEIEIPAEEAAKNRDAHLDEILSDDGGCPALSCVTVDENVPPLSPVAMDKRIDLFQIGPKVLSVVIFDAATKIAGIIRQSPSGAMYCTRIAHSLDR